MTMFTRVIVCITMVVHRSFCSSQLKEMTYGRRSGIVWANCDGPSFSSATQCAVQCLTTDSCLGFNGHNENQTYASYRLCLPGGVTPLEPVAGRQNEAVFFHYNTVVSPAPDESYYFTHFFDGVEDGQLFYFQARPTDGRNMTIAFVTQIPWFEVEILPDCDLLLEVTFDHKARPNTIAVSKFSYATQTFRDHEEHFPAQDFLDVGTTTDVIVFAQTTAYSIFIGGKLFKVYPRDLSVPLANVRYIELTRNFPSLIFTKKESDNGGGNLGRKGVPIFDQGPFIPVPISNAGQD